MSADRLGMRSLRSAMIRHGVPQDETAALAAALGINSVQDIKHVFFQNLLARVPRASSDLRHAFIALHNEHVPDDPWDVDPNVDTSAEWHQIEIHYLALLLDVVQQNAFV